MLRGDASNFPILVVHLIVFSLKGNNNNRNPFEDQRPHLALVVIQLLILSWKCNPCSLIRGP